jgi:integrase
LHPVLEILEIQKQGFHGFRRFRVTHLRKSRTPEDLIKFWLGHAPETVTDGYSQLKADTEFRKMVAEQAGVGFTLMLDQPEPELHTLHTSADPVTY